jgi:hypothetical protein
MIRKFRLQGFWPTLALCALALAASCAVWSSLRAPRAAYGQLPDAGMQRKQMLDELRTANKHLAEISKLLKQIADSKGDEKPPRQAKE